MATKKKTIIQETKTIEQPQAYAVEAKTAFVDSVVDWNLVRLEGYITDTPINDLSKLIRYQEDDKQPENKFFTKK
jgi:hypothetical protein